MKKQLFTLMMSIAFVSPVFASETNVAETQVPVVETAATPAASVVEAPACELCQKPAAECVCHAPETVAPVVVEAETTEIEPAVETTSAPAQEEAPELSDEEIELMIKKLIEEQQAQEAAQAAQQPATEEPATENAPAA